ncbi:MAG: FkbM family methyltransferase [Sphaerospermopsis sp. SIO1G2]|nr:FkbM family methyltransferase [Sphaerospermopsis sp. SIO1G2]
MNIQSITRDLWLLTNFRNGWEMVSYLRHPKPISKAILRNGTTIVHPEKLGLVEAIIELWHEKAYFPKDFYTPKTDDVIVDLGANIGLFTLQAAKLNPDARIFSFEPFPENFSYLYQNISNFGLDNVMTYQYAISNSYRQDFFQQTSSRSLDHQLVNGYEDNINDSSADLFSVEVIPIDAIFDIANIEEIAMLKIDIEGSELDIFKSISDSILKRIKLLAIEYHDNLRPGTLDIIRSKLKYTHDIRNIPSNLSGCGLLFASPQAE